MIPLFLSMFSSSPCNKIDPVYAAARLSIELDFDPHDPASIGGICGDDEPRADLALYIDSVCSLRWHSFDRWLAIGIDPASNEPIVIFVIDRIENTSYFRASLDHAGDLAKCRIFEDQAGWNCATMGNRKCGPDQK